MIHFALGQLKSNRKSVFLKKLPTKPGSRWTITINGQKTDSSPEDVKEVVSEDSDSEGNVDDDDDSFDDDDDSFDDDSYGSSSSDDNEGTQSWLHF